ncbi:MAG: GntR family transcriptional regulator [Verrucomicrobiales bacterium]|nr:GntR family transcriptional regulator [Verrucomicrobiales bacterium]
MAERTQAEEAYKELGHRILVQEIEPNERIKEEFWASRLNVSRAAIRESLTRLLGEGMVRSGEKGGFFASELSDEDINEVREVRVILETGALLLACDRATTQQLNEIKETCEDFANFVKKNYLGSAHEADLRFHQLLVAAAGNKRLTQLYHRSHIPLFLRKTAPPVAKIEEYQQTEKDHRAIYEALRKRDKKAGVELLKAHFSRGAKEALSKA